MKHSIIHIILIFLFSNFTEAQDVITRTGLGGAYKYDIHLPPNYPAYIPQTNKTSDQQICRSIVFFEFGDGTFAKQLPESHSFNVNAASNALATVHILYDSTARPPRGGFFARKFLNSEIGSTPNKKILNDGEMIRVTPSINSVVPNDTMTFAVTFRQTAGLKYDSVYIMYNEKNDYGGYDFYTLDPSAQLRPQVPYFRKYGLPVTENYRNRPAVIGEKYQNFISFKISGISDYDEHTVFFSLVPNDNLVMKERPLINVSARLVNIDADSPYDPISLPLNMPAAESHDPNWLIGSPKCLELPVKKDHIITYKMHFQNTSNGGVDKLVVKLKLPRGVDMSNIRIPDNRIRVGGKDYLLDGTNFSIDKPAYRVTITLNQPSRGFILNPLTNAVNMTTDSTTMGDITLLVKTTQEVDNIMRASMDVIFNNNDPMQRKDEIEFRHGCDCVNGKGNKSVKPNINK